MYEHIIYIRDRFRNRLIIRHFKPLMQERRRARQKLYSIRVGQLPVGMYEKEGEKVNE